MAYHRDLGAASRLTGGAADLDDPFGDLGNLQLEQLHEEIEVCPGKDHLGSLGVLFDIQDVSLDTVTLFVPFPWHLLLGRKFRLGLAKVHDDGATAEPVNDAVDDLSHTFRVGVEDHLPLGFPELLYDNLLGGLGSDTAKLVGVDLDLHLVTRHDLRVELPGLQEGDLHGVILDLQGDLLALVDLDVSRIPTHLRVDVGPGAVYLFSRCDQCGLDGLHQGFLVDPFFPFELGKDQQQFLIGTHCRVLN